MNVAATLPFVGIEISDAILYAAIVALGITIAIAIIWKSMGKGALIALILLGVIAYLAMNR